MKFHYHLVGLHIHRNIFRAKITQVFLKKKKIKKNLFVDSDFRSLVLGYCSTRGQRKEGKKIKLKKRTKEITNTRAWRFPETIVFPSIFDLFLFFFFCGY